MRSQQKLAPRLNSKKINIILRIVNSSEKERLTNIEKRQKGTDWKRERESARYIFVGLLCLVKAASTQRQNTRAQT